MGSGGRLSGARRETVGARVAAGEDGMSGVFLGSGD